MIQRKSEFSIFILFISILIGSAIACISNSSNLVNAQFFYGLTVILCGGLIFTEIKVWGRIGIISPLVGTLVGFVYFFCLTPLLNPNEISFILIDSRRYSTLLIFINLSIILFAFGYYVSSKLMHFRTIKWGEFVVSERSFFMILIILTGFFFGLLITLSIINQNSILLFFTEVRRTVDSRLRLNEGISSYLLLITDFLCVGLASISSHCLFFNSRKYQKIFSLGVLCIVSLYVVNSGTRYLMAYVIGAFFVYYILVQINYSKRIPPVVIFIAILVMFILAIFQIQARSMRQVNIMDFDFRSIEIGKSFLKMFDSFSDQNWWLEGAINAIKNNQIQPLNGETLFSPFVAFIPRALWPGKPGGVELYQTVLLAANPLAGTSLRNISFSILGELILNFGAFGILGMFLWGGITGWWWKKLIMNMSSTWMQVLYSMTPIPMVFIVRGNFNTMFAAFFYPALILFLLFRVFHK